MLKTLSTPLVLNVLFVHAIKHTTILMFWGCISSCLLVQILKLLYFLILHSILTCVLFSTYCVCAGQAVFAGQVIIFQSEWSGPNRQQLENQFHVTLSALWFSKVLYVMCNCLTIARPSPSVVPPAVTEQHGSWSLEILACACRIAKVMNCLNKVLLQSVSAAPCQKYCIYFQIGLYLKHCLDVVSFINNVWVTVIRTERLSFYWFT